MRASESGSRQATNWLLWGGSLITLWFWSALNDPFNAPKSWVLSIAGFWLLGWIAFQIKAQITVPALKWAMVFVGTFLLALSISFLRTDNKYIGFFGEYQRRTGYLSYFCLTVFFVASSFIFRLNNIIRLEVVALVTGFLTALYGVNQHFNHDFIHWNNPYNSVLSTLGNPDFAAAVMSIFLIISFGIAFQTKLSSWLRICGLVNALLLLVVIEFSQVRQGLITAIIGITLIIIVWFHQKRKYFAYGLAALALTTGGLALAGMLNKGPFVKYFYKMSVTYRGDYWRAGWRMFIHNPLFGVGIDRYGANFRQYRDATQSLRRGPELVSNAAHDIPIQLAATGGIFVLITFLLFMLFVAWRGILTIRKTQGQEQILATIIFSAWLSYQAQSLISIDNLGIAIWGYILGGAVVGNSVLLTKNNSHKIKTTILQPLVSGIFAFCILIISALFFESEASMNLLNRTQTPQSKSEVETYLKISQKPLNFIFHEPTFEVTEARHYAQVGDFSHAVSKLQSVIKVDKRNYDAYQLLAQIYEYQKNWILAIGVRKHIASMDPFNQVNLLQLGEDEKNNGNTIEAYKIIDKISSFAPNSSEASQAIKDFSN